MMVELEREWTEEQKKIFQAETRQNKKLILLGKKLGRESKEGRAARDKAVKEYLERINRHRTEVLGKPSLTDTHDTAPEFSVQEAMEWEDELQRLAEGSEEPEEGE